MEAACARLKLHSLDAHEIEGLKVDDVEAAATVHQHLQKTSVDDVGVADEWVDTGGDKPVGVIITVKGDGGARLIEIL